MTALALGALLRNTAAAITTFVAVFLVIPTLTLQLPASSTDALRAVPTLQPRRRVDRRQFRFTPCAFGPWTGFGVLCGYAAIVIGARRPVSQRGGWRVGPARSLNSSGTADLDHLAQTYPQLVMEGLVC